MTINNLIIQLFEYELDEDEEELKKQKQNKLWHALALGGLAAAGGYAASQTHTGKAITNGIKMKYNKWQMKRNFNNGNIGGALAHGANMIGNGITAGYHYVQTPWF